MENKRIKKMPVFEILRNSGDYCRQNFVVLAGFTLLNYFLLVCGIYVWKTFWLLPIVFAAYVLWSYFFRYYFKRKPYLDLSPIFYSMVPSTKIVVLSVLFMSVLVVLPFVPLFLGLSPEFNEKYAHFLQKYMQDSDWVDLGLNLIVVLFSPWLIYRPFLAWISALIGRSGKLGFAWSKSAGNYFEFLVISLAFNFGMMFLNALVDHLGLPLFAAMFLFAPLFVFLNVVLAKIYEFFFLDNV